MKLISSLHMDTHLVVGRVQQATVELKSFMWDLFSPAHTNG